MARDAYAARNSRKQAKGQGCALLIVIGASVIAVFSCLVAGGWPA